MRFAFEDKVRIKSGFFKGRDAVILNFKEKGDVVEYEVKIDGLKDKKWLKEEEIDTKGFFTGMELKL